MSDKEEKKQYVINVLFTFDASYEVYGTREEVEKQCELIKKFLSNRVHAEPQDAEWESLPAEFGAVSNFKSEIIECEDDDD